MKVSLADQHEPFYREFDSPLMRQIRLEAYGEDIGQHSWVSADELRRDAQRLGLSASSRLLELAVDVVLHLRDRQSLFREVSKLLRPEGRFLFTDAGVITGAVSNDELQRRSLHSYTQFVPIGWNASRAFPPFRARMSTSRRLQNWRGAEPCHESCT